MVKQSLILKYHFKIIQLRIVLCEENDNSPLDSSQKTGGQTLQDNAILSNAELGLELSYPKNWSISQGYNTAVLKSW